MYSVFPEGSESTVVKPAPVGGGVTVHHFVGTTTHGFQGGKTFLSIYELILLDASVTKI